MLPVLLALTHRPDDEQHDADEHHEPEQHHEERRAGAERTSAAAPAVASHHGDPSFVSSPGGLH